MSHFASKVEYFYKNFWKLLQPYNTLVVDIANRSRAPTLKESLVKVVSYICGTVRYDTDQNLWGHEDYWATAYEVMQTKAADCDDYALLGSSVLSAMGIDHYLVMGHLAHQIQGLEATPEHAPGHVWLEVDENGTTYILELTTSVVYAIKTGDYDHVPYHPFEWVLVR